MIVAAFNEPPCPPRLAHMFRQARAADYEQTAGPDCVGKLVYHFLDPTPTVNRFEQIECEDEIILAPDFILCYVVLLNENVDIPHEAFGSAFASKWRDIARSQRSRLERELFCENSLGAPYFKNISPGCIPKLASHSLDYMSISFAFDRQLIIPYPGVCPVESSLSVPPSFVHDTQNDIYVIRKLCIAWDSAQQFLQRARLLCRWSNHPLLSFIYSFIILAPQHNTICERWFTF